MAGTDPATGALAVLGIERVGDIHHIDDLRERHERLLVVGRAVVTEIDEDLRGSPVRILESVGDRTAAIRLTERIVRNVSVPPGLRNRGITIDSELRPRRRADAEESRTVVISRLYQAVEA